MKKLILIFTAVTLLSACGIETGDNIDEVKYPASITWVGDLCLNGSDTFIALAGNDITLSWYSINYKSQVFTFLAANDQPYINHDSEITCDGKDIWVTAYGFDAGVPQSLVYQVDQETGNVLKTIPCPATATGFCEGITWDGTELWSGASDTNDIVGYDTDGVVTQAILDPWGTVKTTLDLDWSSKFDTMITVKDGYTESLDTSTGSLANKSEMFIGLKGGWDGDLFWVPDNGSKIINGILIREL